MTDVILESTTKPENPKKGIKYEGNWHTVIGKAANYVDRLNVGDTISVTENENRDVVFISTTTSLTASTPTPIIPTISKLETDFAAMLINQETIIKQNATIVEMLLKLLKNFNLV